jgi:HAD superfamily hydrolase (TIGR01490 family)
MIISGNRGVALPGDSEAPRVRSAAFFDLDNTLISGSSLFHLGWGGFKRGMFSPLEALRFALANFRFLMTGKEAAGAPEFWGDFTASFVKGARVGDLVRVGMEIIDESILPSMRGMIVGLARRHLNAGDEVWIVTASPQELSEILAGKLGFTGGIGTRAEVREGRYTGHITEGILHGPRKAMAVVSLAAERKINLASSSAYSDSANDLPLLQAVGFPHAVTPDRTLAGAARRNGWPVHAA